MRNIETWEDLDRAIGFTAVLAEHQSRLKEYCDTFDLSELVRFVILEVGGGNRAAHRA